MKLSTIKKKKTKEIIIRKWPFEERKICTVTLPYSSANEKFSKAIANEKEDYVNAKVKVVIIWNTPKIQSLFNYKTRYNIIAV